MSLVARRLEESGVATVVVGSARDIVEEAGVPRFVFVDFPLGNPCGKPGDRAMNRSIVSLALEVAGIVDRAPHHGPGAAAVGERRLARRVHGDRRPQS